MITIKNLIKCYDDSEIETIALNKINLSIKKGEFVAIMVPSGCGKTTLLNILGLIDVPTSGEYIFNGMVVSALNNGELTNMRKGNIGFIFQNYNLIDDLNIFENIELPLKYMNIPKKERKERVKEILTMMKINHREKYYPSQLSGGQQQTVAIARAIITNPILILADEPTGNLDSENGIIIMDILTKLNEKGSTIVMVTHSKRDASYAHRIVNLYDGTIVASIDNI